MRSRGLVRAGLWMAVLAGGGATGCDIWDPTVCHTGIFYDVEPRAVVLAVGESFTPTATIESCPRGVREIALIWTPVDPTIVAVEGDRVTALEEGETVVQGGDEGTTRLVEISVTVTAAPGS